MLKTKAKVRMCRGCMRTAKLMSLRWQRGRAAAMKLEYTRGLPDPMCPPRPRWPSTTHCISNIDPGVLIASTVGQPARTIDRRIDRVEECHGVWTIASWGKLVACAETRRQLIQWMQNEDACVGCIRRREGYFLDFQSSCERADGECCQMRLR